MTKEELFVAIRENINSGLLIPQKNVGYYSKKKNNTFECCAIGVIFLSTLTIDKMSLGYAPSHMWRKLTEIFSGKTIMLMEYAFEANRDKRQGFIYTFDYRSEGDELSKYFEFGSSFINDKDRLLSILSNVEANNGEFIL